jgi:hypothetical protein
MFLLVGYSTSEAGDYESRKCWVCSEDESGEIGKCDESLSRYARDGGCSTVSGTSGPPGYIPWEHCGPWGDSCSDLDEAVLAWSDHLSIEGAIVATDDAIVGAGLDPVASVGQEGMLRSCGGIVLRRSSTADIPVADVQATLTL